jgi:hypothetical protein
MARFTSRCIRPFFLLVTILSGLAPPCWGAEHVSLRNGFDLFCDHVVVKGDHYLLYVDQAGSSFLEVARADIVSITHISFENEATSQAADPPTAQASSPISGNVQSAGLRKLIQRYSSVADLRGLGQVRVTWLKQELVDALTDASAEADALTPEQLTDLKRQTFRQLDLQHDLVFLVSFIPARGFSLSHPDWDAQHRAPKLQLIASDDTPQTPTYWSPSLQSPDSKLAWFSGPSVAYVHFNAHNPDRTRVVWGRGFALTLNNYVYDENNSKLYSAAMRFSFYISALPLQTLVTPGLPAEDQAAVSMSLVDTSSRTTSGAYTGSRSSQSNAATGVQTNSYQAPTQYTQAQPQYEQAPTQYAGQYGSNGAENALGASVNNGTPSVVYQFVFGVIMSLAESRTAKLIEELAPFEF